MLFVDPKKLSRLTAAARDCLTDVKEGTGQQVIVPQPSERDTEAKALAFLTMLCGLGPIAAGGTVFVTGFGTDNEQQFPREAVTFDQGK